MRRIAVWILLLLPLLASSASAQALFGKNKVVYEDREWLVYERDWIQVYFYPEEEELARFTLEVALDTYAEYRDWFDFEFEEPIPLILYGTHHDLKQTHVIPGFISDGTAGFTEFVKGRIALRGTGNRAELRHLIRHEMVHSFMLTELATVMTDHQIYEYEGPPLWFIEGLAESVANAAPDTRAHMILRDAVLLDGLVSIPEMWRIWGSFQMYKQGESIVDFMRDQYGDRVPALLLDNWYLADDFEEHLARELGLTVEDLDRRWRTWLKRRYFPEVLRRQVPEENGWEVLTESWFDGMPAVVGADGLGGVELVSLSARDGTLGLYRCRAEEGREARLDRLVTGGLQARFETIPLLRSRTDVLDGRWLLFVAKHGRSDSIFLFDLASEELVEEFALDGITEVSSPTLSHDRSSILFSGLAQHGDSDLYVLDRATREVRMLTADPHQDTHPSVDPRTGDVVFASDRGDPEGGRHGLYRIRWDGGAIEPLVVSAADDTEPRWSPDGAWIYYVSDRDGVRNLHRLDPESGTAVTLSNVIGGVHGFDFVVDEKGWRVAAGVYHEGRFRIFVLDGEPLGEDFSVPRRGSPRPAPTHRPVAGTGVSSEPPVAQEYRVRLGLDFVQSVVALDPDLPYGSGASLGFTDLLGDHQVFAHMSTATEEFSFEDLNVGLSYTDRSSRWNRHYGVFRVAVRPTLLRREVIQYSEVRTGGFVGVTYPFSKFDRIDVSAVVRHLERDESLQLPGEPGSTILASGFLSLVHDNSLWDWNGPRRGTRWNLTLGYTADLRGRGFDRSTVQFDYRRYDDAIPRTVIANRVQWRGSFGGDRQFFYLGGPNDLRGVDWFTFAGERTFLLNTEVRLPALDRISLRFPFGALDLPPVRLAALNDVANVNGRLNDTGWIGAIGYGAHMILFPPLVLRMDVVRFHDFERMDPWELDLSLSFLF